MDETPTTNELIDSLTARLSPEGREVQEELEVLTGTLDADTALEARIDEALAHMGHLPEEDQSLLSQIAQLKARAHERRGEEYRSEAKKLRDASLIERALELERAAGRTPAENMTLDEALEVLERHGEAAPD
jgi:hypothetical protein